MNAAASSWRVRTKRMELSRRESINSRFSSPGIPNAKRTRSFSRHETRNAAVFIVPRMGATGLSGVQEGLSLEGRRHRVGLGLLDERGGIRSQRFPFRGIVIRGVLLGETAGAVEGQDPDERVPPWDDPRPLDAEAEFPPERQDTASPSGEPFVHLSLLDPIDSELGLGGHPFRPSIRNMVAITDASGWPRRTRARACPAVEAEEGAGRERMSALATEMEGGGRGLGGSRGGPADGRRHRS